MPSEAAPGLGWWVLRDDGSYVVFRGGDMGICILSALVTKDAMIDDKKVFLVPKIN